MPRNVLGRGLVQMLTAHRFQLNGIGGVESGRGSSTIRKSSFAPICAAFIAPIAVICGRHAPSSERIPRAENRRRTFLRAVQKDGKMVNREPS